MAKHSFGATLTWNSQLVAELEDIGGLKLSIGSRETTVHKTTDRYKTFAADLVEAGDIPVSGWFVESDTNGQIAMIADAAAGTERTYLVTLPAATSATLTGTGFITVIEVGKLNKEGNIPFTATIKPTGAPTFAVSASNNLSNLVLTTATLYPTFAAGTYLYTATTTGASFTVTPTFSAGVCTITANGVSQDVLTGAASSAISAGAAGTVTEVTIEVTETNKAKKVYKVYVTKTA